MVEFCTWSLEGLLILKVCKINGRRSNVVTGMKMASWGPFSTVHKMKTLQKWDYPKKIANVVLNWNGIFQNSIRTKCRALVLLRSVINIVKFEHFCRFYLAKIAFDLWTAIWGVGQLNFMRHLHKSRTFRYVWPYLDLIHVRKSEKNTRA